MRPRTLLALGLFALAVGVLAYSSLPEADTSQETRLLTNDGVHEQSVTERIWMEEDYTVLPFGGGRHAPLYRAGALRAHDGDLLVVDFGTMGVQRFSPEGEHLATYGEGVGQAPGEILHIMDVAALDEDIWLADGQGRTASRFASDGTYLDRLDLDFAPSRMVAVKDHFVFLVIGQPDLFFHVSETGEVLRSHGRIVEDQVQQALTLNGYLVPGPGGGFIYTPAYASYLYYYSPEGELERTVRTIDRLDFPGTTSQERGGRSMTRVERHADRRVLDTRVDRAAGELHQAMGFLDEAREEWVSAALDVYDWESGRYLRSYRISTFTRDVLKLDDRLYYLQDTTLAVLDLEGE